MMIHMFLLDYVAGRFAFTPAQTPKTSGRKSVVIAWTKKVAGGLPPEYLKYMRWPLKYCELLVNYDARYLLSP